MSARERILIENVAIFDGSGSPAFFGEVLVDGDRIAAVAHRSGVIPKDDARLIDGAGQFLMPGMVESHAHITYPNAIDRFYPHLYPPSAVETTLMTVHNAALLLDYGFTSAYSAGSIKPGIETKVRDEIVAGRIVGPRLRAASMEIYFPGDPEARPMPSTPEELRRSVAESADEGIDIIKLFVSGLDGVLAQNDWELALSEEAIAAASGEARAHGMTLSCHVRPAEGIKRALRHGFSMLYHVESPDEEALDMMEARKHEIFCGPTISGIALRMEHEGETKDGLRSRARLEKYRQTVDQIRARGVRVLPFGDYGFAGRAHGQNARDLGYFVKYMGFTAAETLCAATKLGGELMGREKIGMIAEGYLADLLLIDGDPLSDIDILLERKAFAMIMQAGRLHKAPRSM